MTARNLLTLAMLVVPGIAEAQDFTAQIAPNPVMLTAGGGAIDVVVTTNPDPTLTVPITYSFSGLPAGVATGGPQIVAAPYPPVTFGFAAGGGVAPGTYAGTLTGNVSGRIATFPVSVVVQSPGFTLTAAPSAISLPAGTSRTVMVSAVGTGGFSGSVAVAASGPPSLVIEPAAFDVPAGGMQAILITAVASASPGAASVVFTGTVAGAPSRTATVAVTIEPGQPAPTPPVIQRVAPAAVAAGTRDNVIVLSGLNFQPGATISSTSPGVQVTGASVLGPTTARVVVSVRPDAPAGRIQLNLQNPDGGVAVGGAGLLVYPAGALAGPLAVTAMRIVTPRPWQVVEHGESVHARALLATSGTGTVVGTWLLDGIPFDRFTRVVSSGYPVEVTSSIPIPATITGERRLELAIESPGTVPPAGAPFLLSSASESSLRLLANASAGPDRGAGGAAEPGAPGGLADRLVRWTLVPGASGYEVEVRYGDDGRAVRRVTDTWWSPDEQLVAAIEPGTLAVRVRAVFPGEVFEDPTPWQTFALGGAGDASGAGEPEPGQSFIEAFGSNRAPGPSLPPRALLRIAPMPALAAADEPRGELRLALQGTTSATESSLEAPPPLTRLQLSGQADARGPVFDLQATADVAGSLDLEDPWDGRGESRNWLLRAGASQARLRETTTIGFAPPSFFDQAEFLTVTTSGGAIEAGLESPAGNLGYYRSLDLSGNDAFAAFEPEVDAAAYEMSDDAGRYLFRVMLLEATDPGAGDFSVGGEGRALGAIGVVDLGPRLRLTGEAATGEFEPGEGSLDGERDGRAFRLAASGASGTVNYGVTLGHTGRGFVNPANPGFTPGGVSDRTRAELTLGKALGRGTLSGTYRHVRGGVAEAAGDPETTENGASLSLSMPLTDVVSLNLGGNLVEQRGDPLNDLGLPGTDRTQKGINASVTETVGPISLTQSVTWQDFTDRAQPLGDQRVTGFSLFGYGAATPFLSLSANLSTTRIRSAPELGTTDQFLVSLQPTLTIARLSIDLSPRLAITRVDNDLFDSESNSDQYQLVARWSPRWNDGLLAMEVAGDWRRNWTDLDPDPPPLERQIVFTLSLNWQASRAWPGGGP